MATSKIVTVPLENTPGTLAEVTRILAKEKINIEAVESDSIGEIGFVRLVTNNPDRTQKILRSAGYPVTTSELVEITLANKPGELARVCKSLADSNINIEGLWGSAGTSGGTGRVVIRVGDPIRARDLLRTFTTQTISR